MRLLALVVFATTSLGHTSIAAQSAVTFSVELRRGMNAAIYATRDLEHPESWIANFEHALRIGERNHTNSDAFVLGAQFGLSYRIAEFERSDCKTLSPDQLRALVIQGTRARLKYEESKRALGVTDASLLGILHLPIESFALWKGSVSTSDDDTTVIDPRHWLLL